jgi:hypothetical protein
VQDLLCTWHLWGHPSLCVPVLAQGACAKGVCQSNSVLEEQCKKVSGLAGRRKLRVLEERQDNEKVIHSKALLSLLFEETPPPAAEAGLSLRDKAAAFIVPEAVLPTDDKDNYFQVTFSFSLWCHDTDSPSGLCRIS